MVGQVHECPQGQLEGREFPVGRVLQFIRQLAGRKGRGLVSCGRGRRPQCGKLGDLLESPGGQGQGDKSGLGQWGIAPRSCRDQPQVARVGGAQFGQPVRGQLTLLAGQFVPAVGEQDGLPGLQVLAHDARQPALAAHCGRGRVDQFLDRLFFLRSVVGFVCRGLLLARGLFRLFPVHSGEREVEREPFLHLTQHRFRLRRITCARQRQVRQQRGSSRSHLSQYRQLGVTSPYLAQCEFPAACRLSLRGVGWGEREQLGRHKYRIQRRYVRRYGEGAGVCDDEFAVTILRACLQALASLEQGGDHAFPTRAQFTAEFIGQRGQQQGDHRADQRRERVEMPGPRGESIFPRVGCCWVNNFEHGWLLLMDGDYDNRIWCKCQWEHGSSASDVLPLESAFSNWYNSTIDVECQV